MRISPIENSGFLHWSWEDCTLSLFSDARTVVEFIRVVAAAESGIRTNGQARGRLLVPFSDAVM